jgi:hypothetical protein
LRCLGPGRTLTRLCCACHATPDAATCDNEEGPASRSYSNSPEVLNASGSGSSGRAVHISILIGLIVFLTLAYLWATLPEPYEIS